MFPWLYDTHRNRCRMCFQRRKAEGAMRYPDLADCDEILSVLTRFADRDALEDHLCNCRRGCSLCAEMSPGWEDDQDD